MSADHAERQVVAACVTNAAALVHVRDWLRPEHFASRELGALYRHVLTLKPEQVDPVTVGITAEEHGIGWSGSDVIELAGECLSAANIQAHAEIVLEAGRRRELAGIGRKMAEDATRGPLSAEEVAGWVQAKVNAVCAATGRAGPIAAKPALRMWHEEFRRRMAAAGRITGRATPWADVNQHLTGLHSGKLYVIAGRPGMGKSVIGENLSTFDALAGGHPLVFSLEMTAAEWMDRSIAQVGKVPGDYLRSPAADWDDGDLYAERVNVAARSLMALRVEIDETPSLTLAQIEARAERCHMRDPLTLLVVDHLHIMGRPRQNDVSEIGAITSGLKRLAKRLNVPVVALAQLNRGATERTNKRPTMADLRGSGAIEEDADVIILVHREDYYRQDGEAKDHLLELIVDKQRGGRKGFTIQLHDRFDQYRADDWSGPLPEREAPKSGGKKLARAA